MVLQRRILEKWAKPVEQILFLRCIPGVGGQEPFLAALLSHFGQVLDIHLDSENGIGYVLFLGSDAAH